MFHKRSRLLYFLFFGALSLVAPASGRQAVAAEPDYPSRPINFIVPWGTGGGADYLGRALAKQMAPLLGVSLPVLNIPGGTGQTGMIKMRNLPADGYTVEEVTSETVLLVVTGHPIFKFSDFICLGILDQQPGGLLVLTDGPFKTWNDAPKVARSRSVSVAFDGFGSSGDLIVTYLNRHVGTKFTLVPFDKAGERIASVLGKHNEMLFTQPGDVKIGYEQQLRPILIFADTRDPHFPNIPASKELEYAASLIHFRALYIKAGTPSSIVKRLAGALDKAVSTPEFQAALSRESALANSYIPMSKSSQFISQWLKQAREIKAAK